MVTAESDTLNIVPPIYTVYYESATVYTTISVGSEIVKSGNKYIVAEPVEVIDKDGENVFDILQKATKENHIHMEYVTNAVYESAYIEGINNIYELDAGPMSGWTYSVNGEYPSYGSSKVKVNDGDEIVFNYIISY